MAAMEPCANPACKEPKDPDSPYCCSACKELCEPDSDENESDSDQGAPAGTPAPQLSGSWNVPEPGRNQMSSATWMDPNCDSPNLPEIFAGDVKMKRHGEDFDPLGVDGDHRNRHAWFGKCVFDVQGEEWTLDDFIGFGGNGQAYLATYQRSGRRYVVKFLANAEDPEVKFLTNKNVPFSVFKHPNIVTMVGIARFINDPEQNGSTDWGEACHMTFMEAVPNGEIYQIISGGAKITEPTLRHIAHDIVKPLDMLAAAGITHRDLKPDNFVIGERGEIILLDMGHCKFVATEKAQSTGTGGSAAPAMPKMPNFNRVVSEVAGQRNRMVGTPGWRAPEALPGRSYDFELADVFTIGIFIFMLKLPTNPFGDLEHVGGTDWSELTEDMGASEVLWKRWDAWGGTFSDGPGGLKNFLNCLWRKIPSTPGPPEKSRPRFKDLRLAMEKDQATLDLWPDLKWLALKPADPLTLVQELRANKPNLNLKCSGVIEAFAEYVRKEGDARKAFASAKDNNLELGSPTHLMAEELAEKIGCADQVAGLIAHHTQETTGMGMTCKEFEAMAKDWEFVGGETNWNNCGKHDARWFAWKRSHSTNDAASAAEQGYSASAADSLGSLFTSAGHAIPLSAFTEHIASALREKRYKFTRASNATDAALKKEDGLDHEVFDAKMLDESGKDRCHVRMNTCIMDEGAQGKFVLESKIRKGSAIDELTMLRTIKDYLKVKLGSDSLVAAPAACSERRAPVAPAACSERRAPVAAGSINVPAQDFVVTWEDHSQRPLLAYIEGKRIELGVGEAEWEGGLVVKDQQGDPLDVRLLHPAQSAFPVTVQFTPTRGRTC